MPDIYVLVLRLGLTAFIQPQAISVIRFDSLDFAYHGYATMYRTYQSAATKYHADACIRAENIFIDVGLSCGSLVDLKSS